MKKVVALSLSIIVIGFCVYVLYNATNSTQLFVEAGVEIPEIDRAIYESESQDEILTRYIAMAHYANSLKFNGELTILQTFRWLSIIVGLLVVVTLALSIILWRGSNKALTSQAAPAVTPQSDAH